MCFCSFSPAVLYVCVVLLSITSPATRRSKIYGMNCPEVSWINLLVRPWHCQLTQKTLISGHAIGSVSPLDLLLWLMGCACRLINFHQCCLFFLNSITEALNTTRKQWRLIRSYVFPVPFSPVGYKLFCILVLFFPLHTLAHVLVLLSEF